jgi:hypothetical protein
MPRRSRSAINLATVTDVLRRETPPESSGHGMASQPRITLKKSLWVMAWWRKARKNGT